MRQGSRRDRAYESRAFLRETIARHIIGMRRQRHSRTQAGENFRNISCSRAQFTCQRTGPPLVSQNESLRLPHETHRDRSTPAPFVVRFRIRCSCCAVGGSASCFLSASCTASNYRRRRGRRPGDRNGDPHAATTRDGPMRRRGIACQPLRLQSITARSGLNRHVTVDGGF